MTPEDQQYIAKARSLYEELNPIPCTRCEYCLPCTVEINIPQLFAIFNAGKVYNKLELPRNSYRRFVPEGKHAVDCIACQDCESKCPQHIPISDWMVHVDAVLQQGASYADILEG